MMRPRVLTDVEKIVEVARFLVDDEGMVNFDIDLYRVIVEVAPATRLPAEEIEAMVRALRSKPPRRLADLERALAGIAAINGLADLMQRAGDDT